jgi:hypothetical protein
MNIIVTDKGGLIGRDPATPKRLPAGGRVSSRGVRERSCADLRIHASQLRWVFGLVIQRLKKRKVGSILSHDAEDF